MTRFLIPLLLAVGCSESIVYDTPLPPEDPFVREPAVGEELARYQEAAAYSEAHGGRAFLVLRGDAVVFETGQNGHAISEPHHLFSGTKSFSCAAFAALEADGRLTADERVRDTLGELPDEAADLTVDQVLHLVSGTEQDFRGLTRDGLRVDQRVADKGERAVGLGFDAPPGERFRYGSADYWLFGELVQRKTGEDVLSLLEREIFTPIGLRTAGWIHDPTGNPALPYGAFTTVGEWAKYGVLLRDDGDFLGERVLPPGALAGCLEGSQANPAYGRTLWLNRDPGASELGPVARRLEPEGPLLWRDGPTDLFAAAGYHDQRLYVVPSHDLVVVRLSDGDRRFSDAEFLERILQ